MQQDSIKPTQVSDAIVQMGMKESISAHGRYVAKCFDKDGNLKWEDTIDNLVVTAGLNDLLDKYLAGSAYTASFYMGLVDGATAPTFAAADTMASHAGWTENQAYAATTRPATTWSAAAAGAKALAASIGFTADATVTIAGCFLVTVATKGGTTGVLFSEGAFSGGNKLLNNGDIVNVSYTLTA